MGAALVAALLEVLAEKPDFVGDRVAVLVYEKALLDEEDIFSANLILYGKSDEPVVRRIGARWFVTPGRLGTPGGGASSKGSG